MISPFDFIDGKNRHLIAWAVISSLIKGSSIPMFFYLLGIFFRQYQDSGLSLQEAGLVLIYIMIGAGVFYMILEALSITLWDKIAEIGISNYQLALMGSLLEQDIAFFDKNPFGNLSSALTLEATALKLSIYSKINRILVAVGVIAVGVAIMMQFDWQVSLIMLGIFPVVFVLRFVQHHISRRLSNQDTQLNADVLETITEILTSVRTIKPFGLETLFINRLTHKRRDIEKIRWKYIQISGWGEGIISPFLRYGHLALIFWYIIFYKLVEGQSVASLLIPVSLSQIIGPFVSELNLAIVEYQRSTAKFRSRCQDYQIPLVKQKTQADSQMSDLTVSSIVVQNICFQYPSQKGMALFNLTLNLSFPSLYAIVGLSGSGKSSLLHLLGKFYSPTEGEIKINDELNLNDIPAKDWWRTVSLVTQDFYLFSGTIEENIRAGKDDITFTKIEESCKLACIHEEITALPEGYKTKVGFKNPCLSGGQIQRIALARAIASGPKLLLLDEAVSALDLKTERAVIKSLEFLRHSMGIILVTHRLENLKNFDSIFVMNQSNLVETGSHDQLMDQKGVYFSLFTNESQLKKVVGSTRERTRSGTV